MNQVCAAQLGEFVADRVRGLDFMQAIWFVVAVFEV